MQDTYAITRKQVRKALEDGQLVTVIINGEYYDITPEEKESKHNQEMNELSQRIYDLIPVWDREDATPESIKEYTECNPWETIKFLLDYIN